MDTNKRGDATPELEDILDEFAPVGAQTASGAPPGEKTKPPKMKRPKAPKGEPAEKARRPAVKDTEQAPIKRPAVRDMKRPAVKDTRRAAVKDTERAPTAPKAEPAVDKTVPWWKRKPAPVQVSEKVIEFPEEPDGLTHRIGKLIEKADKYAQGMFPDDEAVDPEQALRDKLLPGVDYEDEPTHAPRPRKKRAGKPKGDIPPGQLAKKYGRGLGWLHTRAFLALLWSLPQIYLMLSQSLGLPILPILSANYTLRYQVAAAALGVSALLALDVLGYGALCLVRLRLESETVLLLATAASLADALTMPILGNREYAMPYCGVMSLALFFALWGRFLKRSALKQSCRVAAGATEPYIVTLDERMWNGQDAFAKWSGAAKGYGSQVREPDGAQRIYHIAAPLIILAAGLLSLVVSVGQRRPELFFWALSATLTAGCGFGAFLAYTMPYSAITRRLSKIGGALGGWDGISWGKRGVGAILTDGDLFPPGSVTLNGIKLVGDSSLELIISYAATLIRETGSGMDKPFRDLLRTQGSIYRKCSGVVFHEGGVTGIIGGRQVFVGSGAFMTIMKIALPQGLNVKNAVFCAVDGRLEGIFALNYRLHPAVRPAITALLSNGIDPILAVRDFDLIPEMLRQRFKLPADRMEFPSLDRRRELSAKRKEHQSELAAVLCREGLEPYAEAVVGGKRLVRSTRLGCFFAVLGSAVGVTLAAYLTGSMAFGALSAGTMLVFMLLWMVPAVLVAGWANRY